MNSLISWISISTIIDHWQTSQGSILRNQLTLLNTHFFHTSNANSLSVLPQILNGSGVSITQNYNSPYLYPNYICYMSSDSSCYIGRIVDIIEGGSTICFETDISFNYISGGRTTNRIILPSKITRGIDIAELYEALNLGNRQGFFTLREAARDYLLSKEW